MPVDVITGDKELDKVFALFEPKLRKKIARKAVRKAAKPVRDTAVARVPVRPRGTHPKDRPPGNLKRSIKVRALKRSRRNKHTVGVQVVTGEGFFKGETFYGAFIEFGTKRITKKPFMRPAHDENKGTVRAVFIREIRPLIDETAKELRR